MDKESTSTMDVFLMKNAIDLYFFYHVLWGLFFEREQVHGHWFLPEACKNTNRCWIGDRKPGITVIVNCGIRSHQWAPSWAPFKGTDKDVLFQDRGVLIQVLLLKILQPNLLYRLEKCHCQNHCQRCPQPSSYSVADLQQDQSIFSGCWGKRVKWVVPVAETRVTSVARVTAEAFEPINLPDCYRSTLKCVILKKTVVWPPWFF